MQPTYQPGDTLLGWRWPTQPRVGRVVVAHQSGRLIIKRVAATSPQGIELRGDNPADSTDSRHFGLVPARGLKAVIIAKLL